MERRSAVPHRRARGFDLFTRSSSSAGPPRRSGPKNTKDDDKEPDLTPGADELAKMPLRADQLLTSPDGMALAILTNAINQRQEKYEDVELYTLALMVSRRAVDSAGHPDPDRPYPIRLTENQAQEVRPHWANDSQHIFFSVEVGDPLGSYRDLQPHLYWVDTMSKKVEQWSEEFPGPIEHYTVAGN